MSSDLIGEHELSIDRVEAIFKQAYIPTERDEDGDLVIREAGVRTYLMVSEKKKLITLVCPWGLSGDVDEDEKLRYVNQMNDDLILVRFSMRNPTQLICDYQLPFDGGINPLQLVALYRRFVTVCQGAVAQAPDGMIR